MSVITISRQYGSGGDEIANLICEKTGYRLFDKLLLSQASFEAGLSDQEFIDYSEENYKVKSIFDRLFGRTYPLAKASYWKEDANGVRVREEVQLDEEHALLLVQKAIQTAYQVSDIVIVGRGGQVILKGNPGVLHVRITASLEERILRVRNSPMWKSRQFSDSVEARRASQSLIETNDAASADYLKRLYGIDWSDMAHYHMVINTDLLALDRAAHAIIETAKMFEPVTAGS
jgi:CMP/dCMP kinase